MPTVLGCSCRLPCRRARVPLYCTILSGHMLPRGLAKSRLQSTTFIEPCNAQGGGKFDGGEVNIMASSGASQISSTSTFAMTEQYTQDEYKKAIKQFTSSCIAIDMTGCVLRSSFWYMRSKVYYFNRMRDLSEAHILTIPQTTSHDSELPTNHALFLRKYCQKPAPLSRRSRGWLYA